jgi:hypothetical protein
MNAVEKIEPQTANAPIVPSDLLHRAVASGANIEVLEKLMGLQERWEANQARKAFDTAIASAKAKIGVISKNRRVDFTSNRGRTNYSYEDLAEIARTVDPALGEFGLSYRFRTAALSPDTIAVTCRVSHRDGYSEETTLPGTHDTSGNKNSIQALGSAVTYLQRYTLKAALGLAASVDDDGQAVGAKNTPPDSDDYVERWTIFLEDAVSADEIALKWNGEKALRNSIRWPDQMTHSRLLEAVTRRREELKQDKPPDLITQRLKAEES